MSKFKINRKAFGSIYVMISKPNESGKMVNAYVFYPGLEISDVCLSQKGEVNHKRIHIHWSNSFFKRTLVKDFYGARSSDTPDIVIERKVHSLFQGDLSEQYYPSDEEIYQGCVDRHLFTLDTAIDNAKEMIYSNKKTDSFYIVDIKRRLDEIDAMPCPVMQMRFKEEFKDKILKMKAVVERFEKIFN